MNVVAAVIRRDDRFLLCQRPFRKQHGGLWEFPGGKIQERESPICALKRELEEELGVQSEPLSNTVPIDIKIIGESVLSIRFIETEIQGEPMMLEHQNMGWFSSEELLELDLAPADAKFAARYFKARSFELLGLLAHSHTSACAWRIRSHSKIPKKITAL